jgi:hypothetical protein
VIDDFGGALGFRLQDKILLLLKICKILHMYCSWLLLLFLALPTWKGFSVWVFLRLEYGCSLF